MVKKAILLLALACIIVPVAPAQTADDAKAFARATRDYNEGNYGPARESYRRLVESGSQNPAVFLNLGHANYRLGRDAEAALNYRRTLALDPGDKAARESLDHVLGKLGVRGGLWFPEIAGRYLPFDVLALLGSLLFWAGLIMFVVAMFSPRSRNGLAVSGVLVALLGASASVVAWVADTRISRADYAMVIVANAEVRKTPADNAPKQAALPAGSEVKVIAERGEWSLVRLPDGDGGRGGEGWVRNSDLEMLFPRPKQL